MITIPAFTMGILQAPCVIIRERTLAILRHMSNKLR